MALRPPRLFERTILAIALIGSFYIFVLIVSGGLFYISYLIFSWARNGLLLAKVGLPCIAIGGTILWSAIPRFDRFLPPGLRLTQEKHPKLFEQIASVAQAVNQRPPKEVYLIPNVNAWVGESGGIMGIGSRRIMGIGMPLLQTLSVSEFRAVLAHEFGHYYGGDTKLTPWIYKTRTSIARTIQSLEEGILHIVFQVYGKLFLRITHAISRYQEYVADEVAARVESAQALASGLQKIHAASLAYNPFWQNEFLPALNAGYLPPYAEGFKCFMSNDNIQNAMMTSVEKELAATSTSPYDTHPSLRERLQALGSNLILEEEIPAITLLDEIPLVEKELFVALNEEAGKNLQVVHWASIGESVYLPMWKGMEKRYKSILEGIALADIPDIAGAPREFIRKIELVENRQLSVNSGYLYAKQIIAAAISVKLAHKGWCISAMPGEAVKLINQDNEFEPFKAINDLFEKKLTILAWQQICQQVGIYEMTL